MEEIGQPLYPQTPASLRRLSWALRLAIAAQCLAMAWLTHFEGSSINLLLYGYWGWPENTVVLIDQCATWTLAAMAVLVLFWPAWPILLPLALWALAEALVPLGILQAENAPFDASAPGWIALAARGARYCLPLGLILIWPLLPHRTQPGPKRMRTGMFLLRLGVATTFVGHGLKAIAHDSAMIGLIVHTAENFKLEGISEDMARQALTIIGGLDLMVASLLMITRWRWIAGWMAFWTFIAACSRLTASWDWHLWHEVPSRAAYFGIPLGLAMYWHAEVVAARAAASASTLPTGPSFFVRMLWRLAAVNLLILLIATATWFFGENGYVSLRDAIARSGRFTQPPVEGDPLERYEIKTSGTAPIRETKRPPAIVLTPDQPDTPVKTEPTPTAVAVVPTPTRAPIQRPSLLRRKAGFVPEPAAEIPTPPPVVDITPPRPTPLPPPPSEPSGGGSFFRHLHKRRRSIQQQKRFRIRCRRATRVRTTGQRLSQAIQCGIRTSERRKPRTGAVDARRLEKGSGPSTAS